MQEKGDEQLWQAGDKVRIRERGKPGSERAAFTYFGGWRATVVDPRPETFAVKLDGFPVAMRFGQHQVEAWE